MMNPEKRRRTQNLVVLLLLVLLAMPISYAKGKNAKTPKAIQQERILKGTVQNSKGLPLSNVAVLNNLFKGGTSTDEKGNYSIAVKTGDKLVFSFIGYETQVFEITNQEVLNVIMKEDVEDLDEIVLVGYGKQKRNEVSSSVAFINSNKLSENLQLGTTLDRNLSGLVRGVYVKQGSGQPGKGVDINIRGVTSPFASNSDNNPLYVVDGVPFYTNPNDTGLSPLTAINPDDVENISILKDAASTAIYGSRGANGVILIKTKKGKLNQEMQTSFSVSTTLARPIREIEYLNASEYKKYTLTAIQNSLDFAKDNFAYAEMLKNFKGIFNNMGITNYENELKMTLVPIPNPPFMKVEQKRVFDYNFDPNKVVFNNADTNWANEIFRNPSVTNTYNFSFQGGGSAVSYRASLGYVNQEGLVKGEDFKQYNLNLGLDGKLRKGVSTGMSINVAMTDHHWGYNDSGNFSQMLSTRPDFPVYDEKGNFTFINTEKENYHRVNPLGIATGNKNKREGLNGTINTYLQVEPIQNLALKLSVGGTLFSDKKEMFAPGKYDKDGFQYMNNLGETLNPDLSELTYNRASSKSLTIDLTATYYKKIKLHNISGMLGTSRYRTFIDAYEGGTITDFPDDDILTIPAMGKDVVSSFGVPVSSGINSGFGRINYNYDQRYSLSGTIRFDKSSKFGPNHKSAWFPSVALGWNIHNEKFFSKATKIVNVLKLRSSYGISGTANVADFSFKKYFYPSGLYNGGVAISSGGRLPNEAIGWEKTTELDLGLEMHLLDSKIIANVDVYDKDTDGVIMDLDFPKETGKSEYTANFGKINNKGIEFDLTAYLFRKENFEWSVGFNASKNINTLKEADLSTMSEETAKRFQIGESTNLIRGYKVDGIIKDTKMMTELNEYARKRDMEINNKPIKDENIFYNNSLTAAGDFKYRDIDGDGKITDKDGQEILGSANPDWFGGFYTRVRYKNFELASSFSFSTGAKMLRISDQLTYVSGDLPFNNVLERYNIANRWSPTNKDASLPRLIYQNPSNIYVSSENVFDASYVKWRSLQLSYKLPIELLQKVGLTNISFFIKGNNLYTWTKYPGADPEASNGGMSEAGGSRTFSDPYPTAKSWSFGFNVRF